MKTKKKSPDRNREISGKKGTKEEELKQREEERDLNVMQGEKRSSTHWENRLRSRRKRETGKKFDSKGGETIWVTQKKQGYYPANVTYG